MEGRIHNVLLKKNLQQGGKHNVDIRNYHFD